jgi:hypothetical protein
MIDISDKVMQAIELLEMMTEEEAVAWLEGVLEGDCDVENYV